MKQQLLPGLVGFVVATLFIGGGSVTYLTKKSHEVRRGWNLKPVVVAAVDIPEGTELTFDLISQRSLPEQFTSEANVRPDEAAAVVGQKVNGPIQAGDPIIWQHFIDLSGYQRVVECSEQIADPVRAAGDAVRDATAAKFAAAAARPKGLELGKVPKPDANDEIALAGVSRDVAAGTKLTRADLTPVKWPRPIVTESAVPEAQLSSLVGAVVLAPMKAGDPVLWQLVDSGEQSGSLQSCVTGVAAAVHAAREQAAIAGAAKVNP